MRWDASSKPSESETLTRSNAPDRRRLRPARGMITEGDLLAVHSNYKTWNSRTRSHAQPLAQSTIDGHSQAEPHANLERLLAATT
jgi:hypothetical protein